MTHLSYPAILSGLHTDARGERAMHATTATRTSNVGFRVGSPRLGFTGILSKASARPPGSRARVHPPAGGSVERSCDIGGGPEFDQMLVPFSGHRECRHGSVPECGLRPCIASRENQGHARPWADGTYVVERGGTDPRFACYEDLIRIAWKWMQDHRDIIGWLCCMIQGSPAGLVARGQTDVLSVTRAASCSCIERILMGTHVESPIRILLDDRCRKCPPVAPHGLLGVIAPTVMITRETLSEVMSTEVAGCTKDGNPRDIHICDKTVFDTVALSDCSARIMNIILILSHEISHLCGMSTDDAHNGPSPRPCDESNEFGDYLLYAAGFLHTRGETITCGNVTC